ncbi:hypothetical protein O4H61_00715 [Roseovarius aestuarii]|nr:hypothetical protein [Roseovarius aestuarii]
MHGGSGADEFHFDRGEGIDVINDFEDGIDTVAFDKFSYLTSAADAVSYATESGADVIFDFGSDGMVTVLNATIAQLIDDIDIV